MVAVEAEEASELEETMGRMRLLPEPVAHGVDKAHKVLPHRRLAQANAAWFRLFLPTEFLLQRLEMPVKGYRTICRSNRGRPTC